MRERNKCELQHVKNTSGVLPKHTSMFLILDATASGLFPNLLWSLTLYLLLNLMELISLTLFNSRKRDSDLKHNLLIIYK